MVKQEITIKLFCIFLKYSKYLQKFTQTIKFSIFTLYMFVEFKKLSFCNIMSYGASGAEIDFQTGLNTIKAVNGSGKSSILDALTFVLFGKPYRDIRLSELVNTTNGKGLEVTCEFKIGTDLYMIRRGLKPAIFEIYKNGKEMDMLSTKKLNQDEIDKLLGINLRLFKNIVAVAVTNNKPFLSLSIGDKRALIENIFNIDVLGLMCKDVKKRKTISNTELDLKTTELRGVTNSIEDNESYIENMKKYIASFNEVKDTNIKTIQENIDKYQKEIDKRTSNVLLAESKIKELTEEIGSIPDRTIGESLNMEIGKVQSIIDTINNTLSKLKKSRLCPVCNSPLDEGHARKHIEEMIAEKKDMEKVQLPSLMEKYNAYNSEVKAYQDKQSFIQTIRDKARTEEITRSTLETELNRAKQNLEKESTKVCPASVDVYVDKLNKLRSQCEVLNKDIEFLTEKILIDTQLIKLLGDDGIKTYFFKKLVKVLNKSVNEYLKKFELKNTIIEFDETMTETMTTNMVPRTYSSYSSGERTRIDMSILLAFFDISRQISNWSCNILFIDELLDQNIDQSGIEQFVATLHNLIQLNKKKLGIYIISHKLNELKIQMTSTIEIKKVHDYSILEVKYG